MSPLALPAPVSPSTNSRGLVERLEGRSFFQSPSRWAENTPELKVSGETHTEVVEEKSAPRDTVSVSNCLKRILQKVQGGGPLKRARLESNPDEGELPWRSEEQFGVKHALQEAPPPNPIVESAASKDLLGRPRVRMRRPAGSKEVAATGEKRGTCSVCMEDQLQQFFTPSDWKRKGKAKVCKICREKAKATLEIVCKQCGRLRGRESFLSFDLKKCQTQGVSCVECRVQQLDGLNSKGRKPAPGRGRQQYEPAVRSDR